MPVALRRPHAPNAAAEESRSARREMGEWITYHIVMACRRTDGAPHVILMRDQAVLRPRGCRRFPNRRDGRVVEGARLESVYRGNSIEGSNPSLSASNLFKIKKIQSYLK